MIYGSFSIAGVHYGTGRHHADLPINGIVTAKNYWWYCYLGYCTTMVACKLSVGWFLLRITVKRIHVYVTYFAMFISIVAGICFFFVTIFQCNPVSYFWDTFSQEGTCINPDVIVGLCYLYSAFNIISDFTFAVLPAFIVWGLQLDRRTKIALIPLLTMGCM